MGLNRREFVKRAALGTAVAPLFGMATLSAKASVGSSLEPLRFGVIGFRGRGKGLIGAIKASKDAKLVGLAEVDAKALNQQDKNDASIFRTDDFRRLLDRNDIDCIASATPNHWHALVTVWATQAGKHVYIEKPISHNMFESRAIVASARQTRRLVQCGFQNRSEAGLIDFFGRLNAGEFGKVQHIHGTCHRPRKTIGKRDTPLVVPKHINYDMWLGPAADQKIMRPSLHYDWHWDFNTGNGDVGNQGPHEWDMMNWAAGDPECLPEKMQAAGNRFGWNDAGNTPNVMACSGRIDGIPFCFEVMDLIPGDKPAHGRGVGVIVETEKGIFVGGRGGGRFTHSDGNVETFRPGKNQNSTNDHMQNFIDAVLTDDGSKLRADCSVASRSSSMAHMANISYQLASEVSADQARENFSATSQQRDMIGRLTRSPEIFARSNKTTVESRWQVGPKLDFSNDKNEFVGGSMESANQKMSREYRGEYKFPQLAMS